MSNPLTKHQKSSLLCTNHGLTLVEIVTVLVIISLLALFAAPEVINWRPKMWLKDSAEELFANMQRAKTHALKNNVDVDFTFTTGAPCPGGNYSFDESISGTTVASGAMTDGVCLSNSTFAAGEGITSRGLPINGVGGVVTVTHADVAGVQYQITLSVAGGISID